MKITIWKHKGYWKVKPFSTGPQGDMGKAFQYCLELNRKEGAPEPEKMLPPWWPEEDTLTVGDYTKRS